MVNLDATDRIILDRLQANSDINIKELAEELNLTKTPVYERIKRMEREGLIEKYVAVLDSNYLKSSIVIFCSVSLENQKLQEIKDFSNAVENIREVIECYLMGGANDCLLKVIVEDLDAYHQFSSGKLAALPNVSQIKSTFVLNEVKRSSVIPIF